MIVTALQVSSSHLARSYHHLFPVPRFIDLAAGAVATADQCRGCLRRLEVKDERIMRLQCPKCKHVFCLDCDMYIHESLHNCPGCGG
jgi:transcription initiation factor TFIIH subunit 2